MKFFWRFIFIFSAIMLTSFLIEKLKPLLANSFLSWASLQLLLASAVVLMLLFKK